MPETVLKAPPASSNGERAERNIGGRIWFGFVIAFNLLLALDHHADGTTPVTFEPDMPQQSDGPSWLDWLKFEFCGVRESIGRGVAWLMAKSR